GHRKPLCCRGAIMQCSAGSAVCREDSDMSTKLARHCLPLGLVLRLSKSLGKGLGRWGTVLFLGLWLLGGARPAEAGKCPNLVIVLDKSGSMDERPSGSPAPPGSTKWALAK